MNLVAALLVLRERLNKMFQCVSRVIQRNLLLSTKHAVFHVVYYAQTHMSTDSKRCCI